MSNGQIIAFKFMFIFLSPISCLSLSFIVRSLTPSACVCVCDLSAFACMHAYSYLNWLLFSQNSLCVCLLIHFGLSKQNKIYGKNVCLTLIYVIVRYFCVAAAVGGVVFLSNLDPHRLHIKYAISNGWCAWTHHWSLMK